MQINLPTDAQMEILRHRRTKIQIDKCKVMASGRVISTPFKGPKSLTNTQTERQTDSYRHL